MRNYGYFFVFLFFVFAENTTFSAPVIYSVLSEKNKVGKYEKFEVKVELAADYINPYDPEQVDLSGVFISPSNKEWKIFGFYDGSKWKIRFTPNEVGVWRYNVILKDKTGQTQSEEYNFECIESQYHGWIKIAPNKRYLMYDNGTPFYGIGHCRAWNSLATPFDVMKQYGMNMIVIWIGPPWVGMIENTSKGIGVYDQQICYTIENYIQEAEKNDIYIILALWPHDALRIPGQPWSGGNWNINAYSQITTPEGFFSNTSTVWEYQKKLYRYIIARWGYSRALAVWNIIVEINGTTGYVMNPSAAEDWCRRVHQFFKQNDPYGRPTCGSKSGDQFWSNGYNIFDLAEIHTYKDKNSYNSVADTIISYTRQMWAGFLKPNFVGEFGTDNQNLQPYHLHNAIWAALAAGAAITPLDWNDGGSWGDMTDEMLLRMKIFYEFVKDINFVDNNFYPASASLSPSGEVFAMRTDSYAFGWIRNTQNKEERVLTVSGLLDGLYEAKFYDTWSGEYFYINESTSVSGFLSVFIPPISKSDFAFKILPKQISQQQKQKIELEGKLLELIPLEKNPVKFYEDKKVKIKFFVNIQVPCKVKVTIYDINMKLVKSLTENWMKISSPYQEFVWDLKDENGKEVDSGLYIYKIDVINDYKVKDSKLNKIMIIK
ncbi:MAG: DUF5060 domain-containing protein [Elusimicrobiota bacterium]|nr:DUF5060 domain-containing protein [Endomicrobiia bacterium]MDW8165585.1 DUF5060 domain-containing protein [Elusimicrobiota bacterium]